MDVELERILICPGCGSSLNREPGALECAACATAYPVRGRVLDFLPEESLSDPKKEANSSYYDLEAEYYDIIHLHMQEEQGLFRALTGLLGSADTKVLDVGTGTGFVLDNYAGEGQFICLDVSRKMLEKAAGKHPDRIEALLRADAERMPLAAGAVDAVVLSSVLHHLPRPRKCLGEIARVLKPGGDLLVFHEPLIGREGFWFKVFRKLHYVVFGPESEDRTDEVKKYARAIFGGNADEAYRTMQRCNERATVHEGFRPLDLVGDEFKDVSYRTYWARPTLYHRLMSRLFPEDGELFYLRAKRR